MRMDIFDKLTNERKINVMEQFIGVYGVDEFINDTEFTATSDIMRNFECALAMDGYLGPPDGETLMDLANAVAHGNEWGEAEAYAKASAEARKWFEENGLPNTLRLDQMSNILKLNNIWFTEDGMMIFIG